MKISRERKSQFVGRKSQLVVSYHVVTNGVAVIFYGLVSHLIGRETINIPEIFSGVHGFTGKTVTVALLFQRKEGTLENSVYSIIEKNREH